MKGLIFDIETSNIFDNAHKKPEDLDISVVGVYSYQTEKYEAYTQETFDKLWELMRDIDTLIGFNNNHFDTPLLNKYAPFDLVKEYNHIDILESVRESLGRRIKLDWIAESTLGIKKSGHGLQAVEWWKNGEVEKVKKYCLDDVKITKEIFEHARENKELSYNDLGSTHIIPIDTSLWDASSEKESESIALFK